MNKQTKMLNDFPEVAAQWHLTKNGDLKPDAVAAKSHLNAWWQCSKGPDHVWQSTVANRTAGRSCPFCAGKRASITNSLATLHPEIARQWHPTKNGAVSPADVTPGSSSEKYWWQCDKHADHVWDAKVRDRIRGSGCSFCRGFRVSTSNSLAAIYPALATEWHLTKNGSLTPEDVVAGSAQKHWWQCMKYADHAWQSSVANRIRGSGCGVCRGFFASDSNSLGSLYPEIAAELHPTKNDGVDPHQVVAGSNKKYWWKCPKGDDHEWEAQVVARTNGRGCPVCKGKKIAPSTSLAAVFPELAKEWHPTKNRKLLPTDVTPGSNKAVWWKCPEGVDHEWEAIIQNRARRGRGCPRCNTGWTVSAVRAFVESLRPHLHVLTPAELYLLFQQNGIIDVRGKSKSFVKALTTGRFPIDEIEKFIEGEPSVVDTFIGNEDQTLEDLARQQVDDSDDWSSHKSLSEGDEREVADEGEGALPSVTADQVLSSLESRVLSSADEEAIDFLLASATAKLWRLAYRDEVAALAQVNSFRGGGYASRAKQRFLTELTHARELPIPAGYAFKVAGQVALPNLMQRHLAARVLANNRVGNWSGTGAGKTLSAIYASRLADARLTVICCPNSVVDGWVRSITAIFPDSDVQAKTWRPRWAPDSAHRYLVLNYEAFQQKDSSSSVGSLADSEWINFLVVDEIHYAKQRTVENMSLRRQMVTALASLAAQKNPNLYVLGMSATPVINNLQEGRSLIDLVTGFEHDDLDVDRPTVPNCMRMHQRLVTLGIRWLPDYAMAYRQHELPVDCQPFVDEIRALGKGGSPLELEKILTRARLPAILQQVKQKTLIYTHYVQGIDRILYDALTNAGWRVGFYTGEDKAGLEGFIEGNLDVLIGSSAVSTGVDRLQTVCNRLIVNVLPWTAAEFEQLKGRIFRQGQAAEEVTMVIPLTFAEVRGQRWSWCESKMQRLRFKKSVADAVVDGIVPEGHLRSPAQAYQDVMAWLQRLEDGVMETVARRPIVVSLDDLPASEVHKHAPRYGDFSEMNRRWNASKSATTAERLAKDPTEWQEYHRLYREARSEWTTIPFEEFIRWAKKRSDYVIGDFGCGEAIVAKELSGRHTVHSFDHVAINDDVVSCDLAHVPLDDESLDVALFSLSLMGANFTDYIREAYRVLRLDGQLHIWEASSRFSDLQAFINGLEAHGFTLVAISSGKFTNLQLIKGERLLDPSVTLTFGLTT
jgi:superfamily II DNA or RNA helicase